MGDVYRCERCGLLSTVISGAIGFAGKEIHCPLCGGRAGVWSGQVDPARGAVVGVELEEDGCSTHIMTGIPEDSDQPEGEQATVQLSGLHAAEIRPPETVSPTDRLVPYRGAGSPTEERGTATSAPAARMEWPIQGDQPLPYPGSVVGAFEPGHDGQEVREKTPMGSPSIAFGDRDGDQGQPTRPVGHIQSITTIRSVNVEAAPPGEPASSQLQQPAPSWRQWAPAAGGGQPTSPDPGPASPPGRKRTTAEISGVGFQGRAWDSRVIREALGVTDSDISRKTPSVGGGGASPPSREAQGEAQDRSGELAGKGRAAVSPGSGVRPRPLSGVKGRAEAGVLQAVRHPSGARTRPSSGGEPALEESILFLQQRRTRLLVLIGLCVLVVALGAILGYFWSARKKAGGEEAPPDPGDHPSAVAAVLQRRVAEYGLEPIDSQAPFEVRHEIVQIEYPRLLALTLDLTNTGSEPFSVIHLDIAWHQVHRGPSVVRGEEPSFSRPVTVHQPLRPGESVRASLVLVSDFEPPGDPRESFAWVEITAVSSSDVIYRGAIEMIEVPLH